ncbi:MAG TPA: hypothetical protein VFK05_24350 [Polyangiaceae bacterium]|nr:hypothetical protein [Polyangiaceae bacterium]
MLATRGAAQAEPVRVTYAAPEICPSEEVFLERVRSRTRRATFAAPGELARSFDVRIIRAVAKDELLGQLEFIELDGNRVVRSLRGSACEQLASSLALITALAIDDRMAEAPPEDSDPLQSASHAAPSEAPPPKNNPEQAAASRPPVPPARAAKTNYLRWELGGNVGVLTWTTNRASPAFGAYAELGSARPAWSVRLSGFDSRSSRSEGAQRAEFVTDWLRLEACPATLGLGRHFSLSPCLAFDAGRLQAEAPNAPGSTGPQNMAWAAAVALARVGWLFRERLSLGLDGELGVPLVRRNFRLVNADNSLELVGEVPKIGVGAKFGVGVRFP